MRLGYVSQNMTLGISASHGFRLDNLTEQRLKEIIDLNLGELKKIIDWNSQKDIRLYRISSKIIPFASHSEMTFDWRNRYFSELGKIGSLIKKAGIRVSMHPGQYTVLNSPHEQIVENSLRELTYHTDFLDLLEMDSSNKVVVHIGGVYGNKRIAIKRFIENFTSLPESAKKRTVIENDENSYSVTDCLHVSRAIGAPVVFDYLHYTLFRDGDETPLEDLLCDVFETWRLADGMPKIHFSTQAIGKPRGSHALEVDSDEFLQFIEKVKSLDFDVMFETKDKEKSALRIKKLVETRLKAS